MSRSRIRNALWWSLVALIVVTAVAAGLAQTVRSPATQFPKVSLETSGSAGAPSLWWVGTTIGFFNTGSAVGITTSLIPGTGSALDLGSSGLPFRNLYLSGALAIGSAGFGDGSSGAPSIFFTSAATLGLYNAGATAVGIAGTLQAASGTSGAPTYSFASATGVGFYWVSGTIVGITGSLQPSASATYALGATGSPWTAGWFSAALTAGSVLVGDGTLGAPTYAFGAQTTLGFYRFGSAVIGVTGSIFPSADNTYDVGTFASANAWRNATFKGQVNVGTVRLGAFTTATNDSLLRNEFVASAGAYGAGMTAFTLGDQSAFGDLRFNRIAAGTSGGDPTFAALNGSQTFWNLLNVETAIPTSGSYNSVIFEFAPQYTADTAANLTATDSVLQIEALHNYTAGNLVGGYSAVSSDGYFTSAATPGTLPELDAAAGDAEFGGNGTVAGLFSWVGYMGTYAPFTGTLGVVAHTGFLHLTQPFQGAVNATLHSAIWVEDQTAGGTYTPTTNYWLEVDTAGGTQNTLGTATGLLGLYGAVPTTTSPLKVGGTLSSVRFDNGNSGTTKTISLAVGNVQKLTLTGNVTLTLTNPTDAGVYNLELFTGAGSFTVTWPASVKWPAGTAPTITVTASRMDLIRLVYDATSGEYWGSFTQNITP